MKEFKPIKEGKVREVYDNGDSLIITATDRISAFDVILKITCLYAYQLFFLTKNHAEIQPLTQFI